MTSLSSRPRCLLLLLLLYNEVPVYRSSPADGWDPAHDLAVSERESCFTLQLDHFLVHAPETALERVLKYVVVGMNFLDEVSPQVGQRKGRRRGRELKDL